MPACPHCGFEVREGAASCPLCGSAVSSGAPQAPSATETARRGGADGADWNAARSGGAESARAAGPAGSVAWEDPAVPFPTNLVLSLKESLSDPGAFYAKVGWRHPFSRAFLYFLIFAVVGAFVRLVWGAVWPTAWWWGMGPGDMDELMSGGLAWVQGAGLLLQFFLAPFFAVLFLAVWTLVLHLFVLMLAPERRSLGATARVECYSYGPIVFTIVPIIGALVATIWSLVLTVVGIREAHRTTTGRAVMIAVLPMALVFLFFMGLILLVVFAAVGAASGTPWWLSQ